RYSIRSCHARPDPAGRAISSRKLVVGTGKFSIQRFILLGRGVPGKIARHRSFYQLGPKAPVAEHLARAFDGVPESLARIIVAKKSVTCVGCRIVILDDFLDSTCNASYREGAILQVVHRDQTRWLKARWNQADVHACLNEMRQFLVVIFLVGKLGRKFSSRDSERGFICGIAFSENDQADIIPKKSIEKRHENLESFLLNNPSNHSEDRAARGGLELYFFKERLAANLFPPKAPRVVTCGDQRIRCRIPARVIDAI